MVTVVSLRWSMFFFKKKIEFYVARTKLFGWHVKLFYAMRQMVNVQQHHYHHHQKRTTQKTNNAALEALHSVVQLGCLHEWKDEIACIEVACPPNTRLIKELHACAMRKVYIDDLINTLLDTGRLTTLILGWGISRQPIPLEHPCFCDTIESNKYVIYFSRCCEHGHLAVAQWLVERFELTAEDVKSKDNWVLRMSCSCGHLEVAQWLAVHFNLTARDARSYNNHALHMSCSHGHLEVAQWLTKTFGLTAEDARSNRNYALWKSCEHGHIAVVQWLVEHFELTVEDARVWDTEASQTSCEQKYPDVIHWLVERFGVTTFIDRDAYHELLSIL